MLKGLRNQKGAFSPFMFGMLMGVAVFSAAMNHWAKKEIVDIEKQNIQSEHQKAEQIKQAFENAILTENINSDNGYSEEMNLARAQKFLSGSTGQTKSGEQAFLSTAIKSGSFKTSNSRVLITTSDDEAIKDEIRTLGSDAMADYNSADSSVVMFDSEEVRKKQIKESKTLLEREASQIYRSYTAYNYKFPTAEQYKTQVNAATGLRDVWGSPFKYDRKSDKVVVLSFTTPWGYTYKKRLDMN
ncbi:MAG: hypothetical protein CMF61_05345 [Magnetococcales bacterium]|nr:hypothetical protein [Magnetococcales bacterium]PPR19670.1 MAG: hypothetical protein CFH43_00065 [Pseudomonadota bacterium]